VTAQGNGSPSGGADEPAPRTDANSKLAHQQMVENLKKGRIDVYLQGTPSRAAGGPRTTRGSPADNPKLNQRDREEARQRAHALEALSFGLLQRP
jgi:hypothetical protein